ncbi:MAG: isocitrate lyase/phosphoenolpyruvate mutase family protein [Bacteroidota bacterium]
MNFKQLHFSNNPIVICNVWDVQSAQIAKQLGYNVIGTSSGAIATMLGYKDGEEISFEELEYIVRRITTSVDLPLTVDLESGYSREPDTVVEYTRKLAQLGVKGINIEDSIVKNGRSLLPANEFSRFLSEITAQLLEDEIDLYVNVRTDAFLLELPDPLEATIRRGQQYAEAGASGLFVPCIEEENHIETVVQRIKLHLNVMAMPKLPSFEKLNELGVKRISMGTSVYGTLNESLKCLLSKIKDDQSFTSIFDQ